MKGFWVKLLLGRRKEYFDFIWLRGICYEVRIRPFESGSEFIGRMERAFRRGIHENQ